MFSILKNILLFLKIEYICTVYFENKCVYICCVLFSSNVDKKGTAVKEHASKPDKPMGASSKYIQVIENIHKELMTSELSENIGLIAGMMAYFFIA
jgi:hypothetical protein